MGGEWRKRNWDKWLYRWPRVRGSLSEKDESRESRDDVDSQGQLKTASQPGTGLYMQTDVATSLYRQIDLGTSLDTDK